MSKIKQRVAAGVLAVNTLFTAGCSSIGNTSTNDKNSKESRVAIKVTIDEETQKKVYTLETEDGNVIIFDENNLETAIDYVDGDILVITTEGRKELIFDKDNLEIALQYLTGDESIALDTLHSFNYDGNVVTVDDEDYKELTTEEFEKLTSFAINDFSNKGIAIDSSDIIKFVMIQNVDRLAQDNKELIGEIVGSQNSDEVRQDAYKYVGAAVMYNYNLYYSTNSTEGFVKISDTIFDEQTRAKVIEIERRIEEEIALAGDNNAELNELIYDLIHDLLDPTSELSYLEAGIKFSLQVPLEPVRGLFGMDLYGNNLLDDTNKDLIKYIVPYAGDEQEYEDNAMLTGAIKDIDDLLDECTKTHGSVVNSSDRRNSVKIRRRVITASYNYENNEVVVIEG